VFGSVLWPVLGLPLTFAVLAALVVAAVVFMVVAAPETPRPRAGPRQRGALLGTILNHY